MRPSAPSRSSTSSRSTSTPSRLVGTLRVGERQIVEIARVPLGVRPAAHPRRAHRRALPSRGGDPVRVHPPAARPGRGDHLHHPPPGRGARRSPTGCRCCATATPRCSRTVKDTDRRAMIEAMIGRRMAEVGRPAPPRQRARHAAGPAIRWTDAGSGHGVRRTCRPRRQAGRGRGAVRQARLGCRGGRRDRLRHPAARSAARWRSRARSPTFARPTDAIEPGVGFLPADRKAGGAFLVRPVAENVAVANWPQPVARSGMIRDRVEAEAFQRWRDQLSSARATTPSRRMGTLSGGNQQKVLLARWLERDSTALCSSSPTRGVDVGARAGHLPVAAGARRRRASPCSSVTSDYEEAVQVADRAYVMAKGRDGGRARRAMTITTGRLLAAAGG